MNKKFMTMIAITAISSILSMNAFGDSGTSKNTFLISGVPIDQVDQSYKNLKIDSTKETYIIYEDSNLSVTHTVGHSWVDGTAFNGLVVNGNCLNMYDSDGEITSENNSCFNQFSPVMSDFVESQSGNFLILQSK